MRTGYGVIVFSLVACSTAIVGLSVATAELSERAPDVLPGTIPEMRNPSFWIARMKNPDDIILPPETIRRMNEDFKQKMRTFDPMRDVPDDMKSPLMHYFPGIVLAPPDLRSIPQAALQDTIRARIRSQIDYLRSREWGNPGGTKYAKWEIYELESEMALDRLGSTAAIHDGIAVRTTRLKNVPSFFPDKLGLLTNGRVRWDLWDIGVVKIGKPVISLHPSLSGEFVLVLCEIGFGWIRSEDIAFGDRSAINSFTGAGDFMLCTGDRVQFYSDESCTLSSGFFRMGDRLPVASRDNPRKVLAPVRRMDGTFSTETVWLARDADVHRGLLPYTRRNIVTTALKLLDNQYDFNGTYFGRQHETTYRDIFACFGFDLPYHGGLFAQYGHDETVLHPEAGRDEQYRVILSHEPFVTIQATLQDRGGHCQLLLGGYNGVPIVFDQHGYSYKDENGVEMVVRRCCIGTVQMPEYFLKRKVTFLELK